MRSVRSRYPGSLVTRILYIEDNDDNIYMLKMRFDLLDGFEVLTAEDGEAGCAKARIELPDLVLMDLDLPVIDGWEATRRLKGDPGTQHIPIIALTAHAMTGSRERALAAGCDEFDTKPIDFDRLMRKINLVLANSRARP
jgi:CheY-like chemotaxis protein